jgi:hypothetical protein
MLPAEIKPWDSNPARYPVLDLEKPDLKYRFWDKEKVEVRDVLRKKWIHLGPEEWVRQHVIHWLLVRTGFPSALLSVERRLDKGVWRTDLLAYNRQAKPVLLVECKAPDIKISKETLLQANKYNHHLHARFVWITNGLVHGVFEWNADGSLAKQHAALPSLELMMESF